MRFLCYRRWLSFASPKSHQQLHRAKAIKAAIEPLEKRLMLTTTTWTNAAGGDFDTAANWSNGVPTTGMDAVINLAVSAPITKSVNSTDTFASLTSSDPIVLSSGTLNITGTATETTSNITLQGGTLQNATVNASGGAALVLTGSGGTLAGVTISAGTVVDGTQFYSSATITGGLTLNGTLNLGGSAHYCEIYFSGSQTLSGTGSVVFGNSGNNDLYAQGNGGSSPATLTIGSGISITGNSGRITGYYASDSIVNNGSVNANVSGGTLYVSSGGSPGTMSNSGSLTATAGTLNVGGSGAWSNTGNINVSGNGSVLDLAGTFATAAVSGLTSSGNGTVNLTGTLNNSGTTLTLTASTGSWDLDGGNINGGTVTSTGGAALVLTGSGGTLAGVTISAGTVVDGTQFYSSATITGGLTLNGTLNLGGNAHYCEIYFSGSQTLGGTGSVVFGNSGNNDLYAQGNGGSSPATLTIGSGISITGNSGRITGYYASDSIVNNGSVNANVSGGTLYVSSGGSPGTMSNSGTLTATAGTLNVGGSGAWSNTGTLSVSGNGSVLDLAGTFPTAAVSDLTSSGNGTVNLTGTLNNSGITLTLAASTGSWDLDGGTINGGTVTSTGGAALVLTGSGGTLAGVTISAGTVVDGTQFYSSATITGGLTLNGTLNLGGNAHYCEIYFSGSQTLGGTGNVVFGSSGNNDLYAQGNGGSSPATLTIGSGIAMTGNSGRITGYYASDSIVNNGSVNASVSGGTLYVCSGGSPGTMSNSGTLTATAGTLNVGGSGAWSNTGTLSVSGNGSVLDLAGTFATAAVSGLTSSGNSTVNLTGTLNNSGTTLTLTASTGSWDLDDGTINGGTVTDTGGAALVLTGSGGTLAGVTISAGTVVDGTQFYSSATITGGLTLNSTLNLGGNAHYCELHFQGSQTLGGTGSIVFGNSGDDDIYAQGNGGSNPATLTIASGITISGDNGYISGSYSGDSIVNNGIVNANVSGGTMYVSGATVTNGGTLEATGGAALKVSGLSGNLGTVSVNGNGSSLTLDGAYVINQGVAVPAGTTLTLNGNWSNSSALNLAGNATLNLGGNFTVAGLGIFTNAGGTVNLTGTLLNSGDTLALTATTGSWNLDGGTISGGTVTDTGGAELVLSSGGTLAGVTIASGSILDGTQFYSNATVTGGLTINGTLNLGGSSHYCILYFQGNQTLGGTGNVVFGNSGDDDMYAQGNGGSSPATLTIASGITLSGQSGYITGYYSGDAIVNNGTIDASVSGGTMYVTGATVTNGGTLEATGGDALKVSGLSGNLGAVSVNGNGSSLTLGGAYVINQSLSVPAGTTLTLNGNWSNSSTLSLAGNGTLDLGGNFTIAGLGTFTNAGGTVNLTGTLINSGTTLALTATTGSWNLDDGTISGGTVTDTGGAELVLSSGGTLAGVTIAAGSILDGTQFYSSATVTDGLTLNGTLNLGGSAHYCILYFQGNQTLGGTGRVVFGNSGDDDIYAQGNGGTNPATLTIGSGITVTGQYGYISGYSSGDSIANNGIIDTSVSGGTMYVTGATVTNGGTLEATGGAALKVSGLSGNLGTVSVSGNGSSLTLGGSYVINQGVAVPAGTTLTLNGNWSNSSTLSLAGNGTLNVGGNFTIAGLGTFTNAGGTVNLTGTLNNSGTTLALTAATGSWNLDGGTISGGTVTDTPGAELVLSSGGTLAGVTIAAGSILDGTQFYSSATVTGGLTLNGTLNLGGSSHYCILYFQGNQTLGGTGSVVFGNSVDDDMYAQGNGGTNPATLTIGSGITVTGQYGYISGYYSGDSIANNGTIDANVNNGTLYLRGATVTNNGSLEATNGGSLSISSSVFISNPNFLASSTISTISITGNLLGNTTDNSLYQPAGTLLLNGCGTSAAPQLLEAMSQDLGNGSTGFMDNFAYGTIKLANNTYVQLVDQSHNTSSTSPEAVYVNALIVPAGATLNLNGLHLYARDTQIGGTVVGGTISQLPNAGPLPINTPTPGDLGTAGELDTWTFFDRGGQSVTVLLDPGSGAVGGPITPTLQYGQIQLLDPTGKVLATTNSSSSGAVISLNNIALPADGNYTIDVRAAASQTASTGHYVVAAWNVTPNVQSLNLNQRLASTLATPYSIDQWNFSAVAGTQVQFNLAGGSATGLTYSLTGPGNYSAFANAAGSSPLIDLPTSGNYTLTAQATGGASGSYAFTLAQTNVTTLALDTATSGTLIGSVQAQLYTVTVPATNPMSLVLSDPAAADHTELYASFGTAPTRETYDYGINSSGSSHSLLIPDANPGTWYVLVYAESVASVPGSFSLEASSSEIVLTGATPNQSATNTNTVLTISGAGFNSGSTVKLVAVGGTVYPATAAVTNLPTQITATFAAGSVPAANYSITVAQADGTTAQLPNALAMAASGQAVLTTYLELPNPMTRHIPQTLYVDYSNTGTVAMPAPLLVLTATNPLGQQGALFTLNPALQGIGLWSAVTPPGYSQSVEILGSGATPGVLQPGETERVAIYYAGWLTSQWDFTQSTLNFSLQVIQANNATPVNWSALATTLQPPGVNSTAWSTIFANLQSQLGNTSGGYVQLLDDEASYLGGLGEDVTDVPSLWGFAIQQANNSLNPLTPFLNSATDDSVVTPGTLALSFTRNFAASISGRDTAGPLGLGWSTPWQISATIGTGGTVSINEPGGGLRIFEPDSRQTGAYLSQPGDTGILSADGSGGYLLTEANGTETDFTSAGLLNYMQDTNGNRITAAYATGLLTSLTASTGQSITIAYNSAKLISSITDSTGRTTTYAYDPTDTYLTSVTGYNGRTTSYTYNTTTGASAEGALTAIASPGGTHEYFTYDSLGRLSGTYDDNNSAPESFAYALGQVSTTNGTGNTSSLYYNENGLVAKSVDALKNPTYYAYNADFNLVKVTNALNQSETYSYNNIGQVTSATDYLGDTTIFTYGGQFNELTALTDANQNTTDYTYNAAGDLLSTTYANGTQQSTTFNPLGEATSFVNANGQPINYTYNSAGQVLTESFSGGSEYTYTYDAHGNLLTATDATGTTTFTYDATSELLTEVAYPNSTYLKFTYNAAGQRTQMVDQTGFTVNYSYTAAGWLAGLSDGSGNAIVTYTYDAAGHLSAKTNANDTYTNYSYDADGNVLQVTNYAPGGAINSSFAYTYNALGLETGETTNDGSWVYTYNSDEELTHAVFTSTNSNVPSQDLAYTYDAMGNRISTVINGTTTTYVTNDMNQYTSVGGVSCTYDANGNLLSDGVNTYTYNALNQLTGITTPDGTTTYTYDALGQQVTSVSGGQTTQYLLDPTGPGTLVATLNAQNSVLAHYTAGLGLTSQIMGSGGPSNTYYYDFDALGSTVGLSNSSGAYVNQYQYLPFGTALLATGTTANRFTFQGNLGVIPSPAGLDKMGARYYNQTIGRFNTPDPIGIQGGINLYAYTQNQVTQLTDPAGTSVTRIFRGVVVAGRGSKSGGNHSSAGPYTIWPGNSTNPSSGPNYGPDNGPDNGPDTGPDNPGGPDDPDNPPGPGGGTFGGGGNTTTVNAEDPNAMYGPAGYGAASFVPTDASFPYQVDFENSPSATAPAQEVTITDQLDADLNWSTFQLTGIGFGNTSITIPAGVQSYQTTVSMTYDGRTFQVQLQAGIHTATGQVYAIFQSIDPSSGLPPANPLIGFLPPENGTGRGEGYFSYTIAPKATLATGTQLRNVADVSFDQGLTIATDQVSDSDPAQGIDPTRQALVTIDSGTPTSSVTALPTTESTTFTLSWSGADDTGGSGIAFYNIYVSDNGGNYTLFQGNTTATAASFTGTTGHIYRFYSVSTDNVGNVQPTPTSAQAQTTLATILTPVFSNLSTSSAIAQGTIAVSFSGTIAAGNLTPPSSENVLVTLNGNTQDAAIAANGNFTTTFNTSDLPQSATPYQVTYAYAGDASFQSVTNTTTTQLTVTTDAATASIAGSVQAGSAGNLTGLADVMVFIDISGDGKLDAGDPSANTNASGNYLITGLKTGTYTVRALPPGSYMASTPAAGDLAIAVVAGQALTGQNFLDAATGNATAEAVYRLYSPVTLEHLYTTDPNEYNTLLSYVGTWNGEGEVFSEYSGPATVDGVTDEPLYRLYDAPLEQHFWTDDYNEYNTLRNAPWDWNDEGIVGYVFPSALAASEPLYRMMAPQVHLWTTDVNEYDTLVSEGWTQEGVIGYVL